MLTDLDKIKQGLIVVGKAHTETYLEQLNKDTSIPEQLKPTFVNIINNSFENYKNQVMQLDDVNKLFKVLHDVSDEARDEHGRWTYGSSSQSTNDKKKESYNPLTDEEKAKAEAEGRAEFAQELDNKQQKELFNNTIKTIALATATIALAPIAGVLLPTTLAIGVGSATVGVAVAGVAEMALAGLGNDMLWGAIFEAGFGAAHSLGIDKETTKLFYDTMAAMPGFVESVDKYLNIANTIRVVSDDTMKNWNNFKTQYDKVISSVNNFFEQTQYNPDKWTKEAKRRDRTANNETEANYPSYSDIAPTIDLEANKLFKNFVNPIDYFTQVAEQTAKEIEAQFVKKYPSISENQKTILHNAIVKALKNVKLNLNEQKKTEKFAKAAHDVSDEQRDEHGRWTEGSGSSNHKYESDKQNNITVSDSFFTSKKVAEDTYKRIFKYSLKDLKKAFTSNIKNVSEKNSTLDIQTDKNSSLVEIVLKDDKNKQIANLSRKFYDNKTIENWSFEIEPDYQGTGIGKQVLKQTTDFAIKNGFEKITLLANVSVGGYAWAKYGFSLPSTEINSTDRMGIENQIRRNLKQLNVSEETKNNVENILKSDKTTKLWDISDLSEKVKGFDETSEGEDDTIKLGKALMLYTEWLGELDLKDKNSMERFKNYVR